jgi:chorismate mutase/prephenate dehydratase
MTKIESRPIEDKKWEYRFFIDFEGSLDDAAVKNALKGMAAEALSIKVLGNY